MPKCIKKKKKFDLIWISCYLLLLTVPNSRCFSFRIQRDTYEINTTRVICCAQTCTFLISDLIVSPLHYCARRWSALAYHWRLILPIVVFIVCTFTRPVLIPQLFAKKAPV